MVRWLLVIAGSVVALGLSFGSGLVLGLIRGNTQAYHLRYLEERTAIAPLLAADPSFSGVEVHERSDGGVYVSGKVPSTSDLDRLRDRLVRAIGEARAGDALIAVSAKQ